jgi:hypothetical protein
VSLPAHLERYRLRGFQAGEDGGLGMLFMPSLRRTSTLLHLTGARYRNHHHKIDLLEMRPSEQLVSVRPGFDGVLPEVGSGEDLRFLQSIRSWVGIG